MIRLACKIPNKVVLACSAGRDSMSALEFLLRGRREVTVAYFNHSTPHGDDAERFLRSFCSQECLPLVVGQYHHKPSLSKPSEASWREARYEFLSSLNQPIVTAHHLGDAVEWWLFSSMRGNPSLIPVCREDINVIRPFLSTKQHDFHQRCKLYPHVEDPTNAQTVHTRNYIRHEVVPKALKVNPGLFRTVANLYERE